jgi:hypothetical protein
VCSEYSQYPTQVLGLTAAEAIDSIIGYGSTIGAIHETLGL